MARSVKVVVTGRVQGVSYRYWTQAEARRRGLGGWVRNRADGSVEAVFCGEENAVDEMIELCHQGPRAARVDEVSVAPCEGTFEGFDIRF